MIIHRIVKRVNMTEVGQSGTNDTYLLLPKGVAEWERIFEPNVDFRIFDKKLNKDFTFRFTQPRNENRITKMGMYYRQHGISAGDIIVIECVEENETKKFSITYIDNSKLLTLKLGNGAFELYSSNEELLNFMATNKFEGDFLLSNISEFKRRKRTIKRVDLTRNGEKIELLHNPLLEVSILPDNALSVSEVSIFSYIKIEV